MSPTSISDLSYWTLFLISYYSTLEKKTTLDMSLPYGKVISILFLTDIQGREGWNKTYSRTFFIFCKGKNYNLSIRKNWRLWASPFFSHSFYLLTYTWSDVHHTDLLWCWWKAVVPLKENVETGAHCQEKKIPLSAYRLKQLRSRL